jgi:hypothetical protein
MHLDIDGKDSVIDDSAVYSATYVISTLNINLG